MKTYRCERCGKRTKGPGHFRHIAHCTARKPGETVRGEPHVRAAHPTPDYSALNSVAPRKRRRQQAQPNPLRAVLTELVRREVVRQLTL